MDKIRKRAGAPPGSLSWLSCLSCPLQLVFIDFGKGFSQSPASHDARGSSVLLSSWNQAFLLIPWARSTQRVVQRAANRASSSWGTIMKRVFLAGLVSLGAGCLMPALNAATFFQFTSAPGSWIGQGQTLTLTNNFSVTRTYNLGAYTDSVRFSAGGYELVVVGPRLTLAQVGFYPGATRWPFMGDGPGMAFSGPGRGNNTLTGCFNVLQADYDGTGQVAAFAVDFVQYDEGNLTKWGRGSIRFNSDIPAPGPPPPMLMNRLVRTNGVVQFALAGPPDTQCVILRSSDLTTWVPLRTNAISPVGLAQIFDPGAIDESRFYRAVTASGGGSGGSNDEFANRIQIPPSGGTVTGSNANATKETGELNHGGVPGGKSVWWTWTPPASSIVSVSLDGSSLDTTLGVYVGTAITSLTSIGQDDDDGAGSCSRVIFTAVAGVTYQIAVDGYLGESGNINLTVKPGILNDAFADRLELKGTSDFVIGSNVGATRETTEPFHWETTGERSVWWKWQAPLSRTVTITTAAGSSFDTILAAYTGTSVSGLSLVANNDDFNGNLTSQISFFAAAGTTYQIAVDGYDESGIVGLFLQQ